MRDREIDMLPSKIVGRRREAAPSPETANALLRTAWTTKQTVRPSDAADRAWLEASRTDEG